MAERNADLTIEEFIRLVDQRAASGTLGSLRPSRHSTPEFLNAYGVCLLRLGMAYEALSILNQITLDPDTLRVRSDVPDSFKINLATAMLLAKNPKGCLGVLRLVKDHRKNQQCLQLRLAVRRWDKSLSLLRRVKWRLGVLPTTAIRLDFAPGELDGDICNTVASGKRE